MEKETNPDEFYASQRVVGKTYFSESFETQFSKFKKKFAHKILDFEGNEFLLKDETTLGYSINGLRQLKALFLQNENRSIEKLIIQQFGPQNNPIKNVTKEASFHRAEVENLYKFLKSIKEVEFPSDHTFNVNDETLSKMLLNKEQATKIIAENIEILQEALNNNITSKDLINFGYRKSQLEIFHKLLHQEGYFEEYKEALKEKLNKNQNDEAVWQKFFEKNTWILGYGLDYIFNSELDSKKLEQVTSGSDFASNGKRIDALLKSQGAINSLCFCELKLDTHKLLKQVKDAYREEAWQISDELSGAIAQVQRTIQKAIKEISTKTETKDHQDFLTGETLYLYNPKAFILIGNLNEFIKDDRINEIKFSSFEMFRKNLKNIDIITYDELYQRAFYICNKKETDLGFI
ncbi:MULTISPECIES: Shedu immune nuclease family protein [Flavobacterium]|uniref:Shedu protein SduA C-terminal domain-containing protein n=1 Tax=Flavobacterium hankyongi TaxID=1176532 RepID=A0ABP8ZVW0_9FLAO|nr:Shedu immune nuclease family protein [Flavobacterium sp. N1846]